MGSSREIVREARRVMVVDDKIFVAVCKEVKESKQTLIWALQNSNGKKICIIYVHVPAKMIPMPMGGKFPVSQVGERELMAFREKENRELEKVLELYLQICSKVGARAEKLHIEMDSIEEGIVEVISQQCIGTLVMGAASDSRYSRKMVEIKSKKAQYVRQHAPDFCQIRFICKGHLIYTRFSVRQPSPEIEERSSNSENDQPDLGTLSQGFPRHVLSDLGGYAGSSDGFGTSARTSLSQSSISRDTESIISYSSPCSSLGREEASGLVFLTLPETKGQGSSSPSVLQESVMNDDDLYERLIQAMTEADNAKREAFEESTKRRKAEREAMDAIRKGKATEQMYIVELRLRKETEKELAKLKEELEITKSKLEENLQEWHEALDQKKSLEDQLEKFKLTEKETQEVTRGPFNSLCSFSQFSFSDLEKATNGFDSSLKIGEGGYGSIYRGFLHHTQVAIKILGPNSKQGPREFAQEVDVLSKLRHPNLVTLIGTCPDSWALIYEYLPLGSLEDRLTCKDNTPPLSWRTRIQIATDLCSVLIFLHSNQPSCVIHGDLKPSNILLDKNFVCKLSDFGICCVISNIETSMEKTPVYYTTEPRGTFTYMDPEFVECGELTPKSDIYSFGIILLRLLTNKPAMGIAREVEYALDKGNLDYILDHSAGDWPFIQAEQLARLALRCCDVDSMNRPDLESDVWRVLKPMKDSSRSSSFRLGSDDQAPDYFMCPIFQEIMEDPLIASDGFTYEAEAIRGWVDGGHDTSPMTNMKLGNNNFIPNHALKSAIQEWLHHHRR